MFGNKRAEVHGHGGEPHIGTIQAQRRHEPSSFLIVKSVSSLGEIDSSDLNRELG
jgi:hypothetical protein